MKNFLSKLIITFLIFLTSTSVFAIEIVYPKKSGVIINSASTFFVGSANPFQSLKINGKEVFVHSSGGFAQTVQLKPGENIFTLESAGEKKVFVINRSDCLQNTFKTPEKEFKKYDLTKTVYIKNENTPIRSTPVETGVNRISHFQSKIPLIVDGENKNLFRVVLNPQEVAWVSKNDVQELDSPAKLTKLGEVTSEVVEGFYVYKFNLTSKAPYTLIEGNPFFVKIFNVENSPNNTAVFKIELKQRLMGYDAYYEGNTLIVKIRIQPKLNKKKPLKNVKIVIDSGHGGSELGALGCLGTAEKDVNLKIAKYLEKELIQRGADVVMTRTNDKYLSLQKRVDITKKENAVIFVSIHNNALPDFKNPMEYRGCDVYYYYPQAKALAENILLTMSNDTKQIRVHQASFAVVRNTAAVSVLVEVAYMINPFDNALLIDECFQKNAAASIANGIENYFVKKVY